MAACFPFLFCPRIYVYTRRGASVSADRGAPMRYNGGIPMSLRCFASEAFPQCRRLFGLAKGMNGEKKGELCSAASCAQTRRYALDGAPLIYVERLQQHRPRGRALILRHVMDTVGTGIVHGDLNEFLRRLRGLYATAIIKP